MLIVKLLSFPTIVPEVFLLDVVDLFARRRKTPVSVKDQQYVFTPLEGVW